MRGGRRGEDKECLQEKGSERENKKRGEKEGEKRKLKSGKQNRKGKMGSVFTGGGNGMRAEKLRK